MGFNIVTVNVSQTIGAIPSNLQQMSAVISFGSTTHEPGKPVLLTRNQDINELVKNPIAALSAAAAGSIGKHHRYDDASGREQHPTRKQF